MTGIAGNDVLLKMDGVEVDPFQVLTSSGDPTTLRTFKYGFVQNNLTVGTDLMIHPETDSVELAADAQGTLASDMKSATFDTSVDVSTFNLGDRIRIGVEVSSSGTTDITLSGTARVISSGQDGFFILKKPDSDTTSFLDENIVTAFAPIRNLAGFDLTAVGSQVIENLRQDYYVISEVIDGKTLLIMQNPSDNPTPLQSYEEFINKFPGADTDGSIKLRPHEWGGALLTVDSVNASTRTVGFEETFPSRTGTAITVTCTPNRVPKITSTGTLATITEVTDNGSAKIEPGYATDGTFLVSLAGTYELIAASTGDSITANEALVDASSKDSFNSEAARFRPSVARTATKSFSYSGTALVKNWGARYRREKNCSGLGNKMKIYKSNSAYSQLTDILGFTSNTLSFVDPAVDVMTKDYKDSSSSQMRVLCPQTGTSTLTMTASGVSDPGLLAAFNFKDIAYYVFEIPNILIARCPMIVTGLENTGEVNGVLTYNFTLESAGDYSISVLDDSNRLLKYFRDDEFRDYIFEEYRKDESTPFRKYQGEFMITQLDFSGENDAIGTMNFQLESAGQVTIT